MSCKTSVIGSKISPFLVPFQGEEPLLVMADYLHCPPASPDFMNKVEKGEFEPYSLQEAEMQMKLFFEALV